MLGLYHTLLLICQNYLTYSIVQLYNSTECYYFITTSTDWYVRYVYSCTVLTNYVTVAKMVFSNIPQMKYKTCYYKIVIFIKCFISLDYISSVENTIFANVHVLTDSVFNIHTHSYHHVQIRLFNLYKNLQYILYSYDKFITSDTCMYSYTMMAIITVPYKPSFYIIVSLYSEMMAV